MVLDIRTYDVDRDFESVRRIWREVGWIESSDEHAASLAAFLSSGSADVALIDGAAECLVHRTPGTITYDRMQLPLCAITAVTTSLIGRKRGFATALTSRALQRGADAGAVVAALGMFEQGFYDRFGFATASYVHLQTFDPQSLRVAHIPYRTPVRLDASDTADMHRALAGRHLHHGAIVIDAPRSMEAEIGWTDNAFALGYRNDTGALTHFMAGSLKEENGPFNVFAIAYRSVDELMELLRLLYELGDQIRSVKLAEPAELNLQVLIDTPMRQRQRSLRSLFETGNQSVAWSQLRILDLDACVGAYQWVGTPVRFELELSDPIAAVLGANRSEEPDRAADATGWSGVAGRYSVTIGNPSTVMRVDRDETDSDVPVVTCDIAAFTRLWFGIAPASSLHATNRFDAPPELCEQLDATLCLPPTTPGIAF